MAEPGPDVPSTSSPHEAARSRSGKLRGVVALAVLLAVGAGFIRAHSQWVNQFPQAFPPRCSNIAGAKVSEMLTVNVKASPPSYTLSETVAVPVNNQYAHLLIGNPDTHSALQAGACLFTASMNNGPRLTSIANGMATFVANDRFPLSSSNEWRIDRGLHATQLSFEPSAVCQTYPLDNWAKTTLSLTIRADTALDNVSPAPNSLTSTVYSWDSPSGACGKLSRISLQVPVSLAGSLYGFITQPTGVIPVGEVLGWLDAILITLISLWLALRIPQAVATRSTVLRIITLAILGIVAAAIDLNTSTHFMLGPAELVAIYAIGLGLVLIMLPTPDVAAEATAPSLTEPTRQRRPYRRLAIAFNVFSLVALLICAYRYPVWFPGAGDLLMAIASILLITIAALLYGFVKAAPIKHEGKLGITGWITLATVRDWTIFWIGSAVIISIAYNAGNAVTYISAESVALSEFAVVRYPLTAFAIILISVALIIPLGAMGPSSDRHVVAAAAFGWAIAANAPDLSFGGVRIPLGTALLAFFLYALVTNKSAGRDAAPRSLATPDAVALRDREPHADAVENSILAIKIAAALALIPVAYFLYSAVVSLPSQAQAGIDVVFIVASVVGQLVGWLIIGIVYSALSTRLPGQIGPVRALLLAGAWFFAAVPVHLIDNWIQPSTSRAWLFPGLEVLLFLVAFSIVWDACVLKQDSWAGVITNLTSAYRIQETRTVVLYAIPVLLALIALGEQVASGSGADFVKSVLAGTAAVFGGPS
jgi:hypothetical protein